MRDPEGPLLGKAIGPREVLLGDKIGEGQFGDVHKGILYPDVSMGGVRVCGERGEGMCNIGGRNTSP